MKASLRLFLLSTFAFLLFPSAFPQGSLTPPGAPAPFMKALDEVEPRINIQRTINPLPNDANYHLIIGAPGSYYLTAANSLSRKSSIRL
jgi:hypothetical protein